MYVSQIYVLVDSDEHPHNGEDVEGEEEAAEEEEDAEWAEDERAMTEEGDEENVEAVEFVEWNEGLPKAACLEKAYLSIE